jgi:hypothetical protein
VQLERGGAIEDAVLTMVNTRTEPPGILGGLPLSP